MIRLAARAPLAAATLVLAIAIAGCGSQQASATCIALFDVSGSTTKTREHQLEGFERMLDGCREIGARVWAARVTGNTLAVDAAPIDTVLAADEPINKRIDGLAVDAKIDAAIKQAGGLVRARARVGGTDIHEAFVLAERELRLADDGPRRLVLFSDGISTVAPLDLRNLRLDAPTQIDAVVERLERDGLPRLDGVEVTFAGAGLHSRMRSTRLAAIEALYRRLVERAGGRLVAVGQGFAP